MNESEASKSVRPSVTCRYYVETAKRQQTFSPSGSHTKFYGNILTKTSLTGASNAGYEKNCDFRRISHFISEIAYKIGPVWNASKKLVPFSMALIHLE